MIKEQGTVVQAQDGFVVVEVLKTSACKSCSARQGCGQAVMSDLTNADRQSQKNHFNIPYDRPISIGSRVELGMAEDTVSKVALLVYLLPLLTGFVGLYVASRLTDSEPLQLLSFVSFMFLSFVALSRLKMSQSAKLEPKILSVYSVSQPAGIIASSH